MSAMFDFSISISIPENISLALPVYCPAGYFDILPTTSDPNT